MLRVLPLQRAYAREGGEVGDSQPNGLSFPVAPLEISAGVFVWPGYFSRAEQKILLDAVLDGVVQAPFYRPAMPGSGKEFSVEQTNFGPLGWVSDKSGYRYQAAHPVTGKPWPAIPEMPAALWRDLVGAADPQCCLVNLYRAGARMGLHQDRDETSDMPVLSICLGDTALFRIGGLRRKDPTVGIKLASGDVLSFGGVARRAYHGIDRILPATSTLVPGGGRINLTLRRVT